LVREVAEHDFDKALVVATWPLVEVLHAYHAKMKREALDGHRAATLVWAVLHTIPLAKGAKKQRQPTIPKILRDDG